MGRIRRRGGAAACGMAIAAAAAIAVAAPVAAQVPSADSPFCSRDPARSGPLIDTTPWAQRHLAPETAWPFSDRGAGVLVAVVGTGVSGVHPQLSGAVDEGFDIVRGVPGAGSEDCVSYGTAVAGIIAARQQDGVGFEGVAPAARILPVRVTEDEVDIEGNAFDQEIPVDMGRYAAGVRWAVSNGADVLHLGISTYVPDPGFEDAVRFALANDVVVIAAAGDRHRPDTPEEDDPVPYPAAYEGVLGVGAIGQNLSRTRSSQVGTYVRLVAPGDKVLSLTRASGHGERSGTAMAAAFVAGTAALVRAAHPELTAPEVVRRMLAAAGPSRGGPGSQRYGAGEVIPYRAVTEEVATVPRTVPEVVEPSIDPAAVAREDLWRRTGTTAGWATLAGLAAVVVITVLALIVPRGRRRRWRPARQVAGPPDTADGMPRDIPAEELFAPPPMFPPDGPRPR